MKVFLLALVAIFVSSFTNVAHAQAGVGSGTTWQGGGVSVDISLDINEDGAWNVTFTEGNHSGSTSSGTTIQGGGVGDCKDVVVGPLEYTFRVKKNSPLDSTVQYKDTQGNWHDMVEQ